MSFWVLKAVSVNMQLAKKYQMMLMNIIMMTFAFSVKDEEDEDYEPRVEVRRILKSIPLFPDISAFGPKSIGALKLLNDQFLLEDYVETGVNRGVVRVLKTRGERSRRVWKYLKAKMKKIWTLH